MMILQKMYDWVLQLAGRPRADAWLIGVSASEAVFFPIPPDTLLIPMGLAQPSRIWRLATWCTMASVAGGLVGYLLGWWGSEALAQWLNQSNWASAYQKVQTLFADYGIWIMLLAGFTPIPYKIFTITAGLLLLPIHWFLITGIVGRGARFFLVAALLASGGEELAERIRPWVSKLGWIVIGLAMIVAIWLVVKR